MTRRVASSHAFSFILEPSVLTQPLDDSLSYGSMILPSDFDTLSSFDPAIHLHPQVNETFSSSNSADLLELNRHLEDVQEQKTKDGVVIQHRAWKVPQAFQSQDDYLIGAYCAFRLSIISLTCCQSRLPRLYADGTPQKSRFYHLHRPSPPWIPLRRQ